MGEEFGRPYRRMLVGVVILGAVVQLLLGAFYLGVGHAPKPREVPLGLVFQSDATALKQQLGTSFKTRAYDDTTALTTAIEHRKVTGGLVQTENGVQAWIASAAGALPAATIRTLAVRINTQQGLTTSPTPNDVVPLPSGDSNGSSLSFILQVLSLGASVGSLGLGRLVPHVPRSLRRGLGHTATLIAYGVASAGILLLVSAIFDVGENASVWPLFIDYAVTSLAIIASTAGLVALIGPAGSLAGMVYFLVGATLSGASIPWNFMPPFWAALGEWLPTGGGAHVIRNSLYFPDASGTSSYVCLGLYAGIGLLLVLVTNAIGNPGDRRSAVEVDVVSAVAGHREHL